MSILSILTPWWEKLRVYIVAGSVITAFGAGFWLAHALGEKQLAEERLAWSQKTLQDKEESDREHDQHEKDRDEADAKLQHDIEELRHRPPSHPRYIRLCPHLPEAPGAGTDPAGALNAGSAPNGSGVGSDVPAGDGPVFDTQPLDDIILEAKVVSARLRAAQEFNCGVGKDRLGSH